MKIFKETTVMYEMNTRIKCEKDIYVYVIKSCLKLCFSAFVKCCIELCITVNNLKLDKCFIFKIITIAGNFSSFLLSQSSRHRLQKNVCAECFFIFYD